MCKILFYLRNFGLDLILASSISGLLLLVYAKNFWIQVLTVGALHQIDSAALRSAASAWHDEFAPLPKPLLVVNIGGPTRNFHIILSPLMFDTLLYLTGYLLLNVVCSILCVFQHQLHLCEINLLYVYMHLLLFLSILHQHYHAYLFDIGLFALKYIFTCRI